jgi:hypothetical protein
MHHVLTFVGFDVLQFAFRTDIVAAATPNISPLFTILGTAIIVDELPFGDPRPAASLFGLRLLCVVPHRVQGAAETFVELGPGIQYQFNALIQMV